MAVPSNEQIEEGYKQARLGARGQALSFALQARQLGFDSVDMSTGRVEKKVYPASELVGDAKLIEEYLMQDIVPPQRSSIIKATTGPSH